MIPSRRVALCLLAISLVLIALMVWLRLQIPEYPDLYRMVYNPTRPHRAEGSSVFLLVFPGFCLAISGLLIWHTRKGGRLNTGDPNPTARGKLRTWVTSQWKFMPFPGQLSVQINTRRSGTPHGASPSSGERPWAWVRSRGGSCEASGGHESHCRRAAASLPRGRE